MNAKVQAAIVMIFGGFSLMVSAQTVNILSMVKKGQSIAVYRNGQQGDCVGAIGMTKATASKARDFEIARTEAVSKLGGFIGGTSVTSSTEVFFESADGKSRDSFISTMKTKVDTALRAAEVVKSGTYDKERYVFVQVCEKNISVSKNLKAALTDNTVRATGVGSLELGREKARRTAIDDAMRNAVAMYSGVSTVAESTVRNSTELQNKVATRSKGTVKRYRIVNEITQDGTIRVEIIAEISEEPQQLENLSQAVQESLGRPSIYVDSKNSLARSTFEKMLKKHEFNITRDRRQARYVMMIDVDYREAEALDDMMGGTTGLTVSLKDKLSADQAVVLQNDPQKSLEASDSEKLRKQRSMQYAVEEIEDELVQNISGQFSDSFVNGAKVLIANSRLV